MNEYPYGTIPDNFGKTYCMKQEENLTRVFDEIGEILNCQDRGFPSKYKNLAANTAVRDTGAGLSLLDLLKLAP